MFCFGRTHAARWVWAARRWVSGRRRTLTSAGCICLEQFLNVLMTEYTFSDRMAFRSTEAPLNID
jgi:hypothetical protein